MSSSEFGSRAWRRLRTAYCALVLFFLTAPILVIVPLSFNAEPYFTFTEGMLALDPDAWSLRWYKAILEDPEWRRSLFNSLGIGILATLVATSLGTLAALGLSSPAMPARRVVRALLISPMVIPIIIAASGMFFFYSDLGLARTHVGLILAHAALGTPFVVITVTATLASFDDNLTRAARSLGAGPLRTFPAGAVSAHRPGSALGRALRVRRFVRRGGDRAVHGRPRAKDHPPTDVVGNPGGDQPRDPRGRRVSDPRRDRAAADRPSGCQRAPRPPAAPDAAERELSRQTNRRAANRQS